MKLWYVAGMDIRMGELVTIAEDGYIYCYVAHVTAPAFATATRNIEAGESISFSQDDDTDLRSRTTKEVLGERR